MARWFVALSSQGTNGFRDSLVVEISNGNVRKKVWFLKDQILPVWVTDTIRISNHIQLTNNMQVHISVTDGQFDSHVDGAIVHLIRAGEAWSVRSQVPKTVSGKTLTKVK